MSPLSINNNPFVLVVDGACTGCQHKRNYPYGEPWTEPAGDNDRWFGGKKRLAAEGLPMSDFGPRLLNHAYPAWLSQDRKLEEYYHLSPYSYCAGNPSATSLPQETTTSYSILWENFLYTEFLEDYNKNYEP